MNRKITLAALLAVLLFTVPRANALEATNVNDAFNPDVTFMDVAQNVADFLISFITILGIIFIIWGAIQYVTSGGSEEAVERAKNTIVYALVGLFIAAMAYALENLILTQLVS